MSIKIKIAERDVDRNAIFRGRHRVYVEEMGAMSARDDQRILDVFDTFRKTVNIACVADGRVVGGLRMTEGGPPLGTPADKLFDYTPFMPADAHYTSSSMLFIEKAYRGRNELIMGLFMMGYFWSVNRGADYILAPVNPPVARKLLRLGFHSVSDRFEIHGLPVKAMLWDLNNVNDMFVKFLRKMEINTFALNFHREFFDPGEYLMRQGDPADSAYVIVEGKAAVTVGEPESDQEKVVDSLVEGDLVGEIALLSSGVRTANVKALGTVDTVVLERERFQEAVESDPQLSLRLLAIVGRRFSRLSAMLTEHRAYFESAPLAKGQALKEDVVKDYNPRDPATVRDPYPVYTALRDQYPVYWSKNLNAWLVLGYKETQALLLHPAASSRRAEAVINKAPPEVRDQITTFRETANKMLLFLDPPDHARMRQLVSKAFSMRTVRQLEPKIEATVEACFAAVQEKGTFDVVEDLAYPFPLAVIGDLLGVPKEDRFHLKNVSMAVSYMVSHPKPDAEAVLNGNRAIDEMYDYFKQLIVSRRKQPADDLISAMLEAEEKGDLLDESEVLINCCLFLFAGHETTTNLLSCGTYNLLRHKESLLGLRSNPDLLDQAIDEMLRYDSPIQIITRVAAEDMTIGNQTIIKGQSLFACLGAANRDPQQFQQADTFEITREQNRHLAFGHGRHLCLGSQLARLEAKVAFRKMLETFPVLKLTDAEPEWRPDVVNRGLLKLPVEIR